MNTREFDCWCKRVMKNKKISYYRELKHHWEKESPSSYAIEEMGWYDKYFVTQFSVNGLPIDIRDDQLCACIRHLNDKRKGVIMLHYFAGYTDKETSDIMGIPRTTVHHNRQRALQKLREEMGERK